MNDMDPHFYWAAHAQMEGFVMKVFEESIDWEESWKALGGEPLCPLAEWLDMTYLEKFHNAVVYNKNLNASIMMARFRRGQPYP